MKEIQEIKKEIIKFEAKFDFIVEKIKKAAIHKIKCERMEQKILAMKFQEDIEEYCHDLDVAIERLPF